MLNLTNLDSEVPGTQSIGRAVQVLRAIAANGRRGCRLNDIVSRTMLSKTTCVRVLNRLAAEQMIRKHQPSGKFFLGPLLDELGMLARPERCLADTLEPMLERIAEFTQDTVYLSEKRGSDAVCTAVKMGSYPIKVLPLDTGVRRPLGVAAGGVALLAALKPQEAQHLITNIGARYEGHDGITQAQVEQRVAQARRCGFVIVPNFGVPGAVALSVPLQSSFGPASVSVTALKSRMHKARQHEIVQFIRETMMELDSPDTSLCSEAALPETACRK